MYQSCVPRRRRDEESLVRPRIRVRLLPEERSRLVRYQNTENTPRREGDTLNGHPTGSGVLEP